MFTHCMAKQRARSKSWIRSRQCGSDGVDLLFFFFFGMTKMKSSGFFCRVDGVIKHLTENRDFDHRLRTLENEVKLPPPHPPTPHTHKHSPLLHLHVLDPLSTT